MKTLPYEMLKILADGKFHSGEELGKTFNITRSAVWKIIKQLSSLEIEIIAVKAKGYQIPEGLELLNKKIISKNLSEKSKEKISKLEIFDSIDSTNQYLLNLAKLGANSGSVCLAEHQSSGRGRRGRRWYSLFGTNLYLSLLWHFSKDPAEISGLSIAVAISIVRALKKFNIENLQLKWPNDILWRHQKLGGVLLEMIAENHETTKIIIGIGLNIDLPNKIKKLIDQPTTDIKTIFGKRISRNLLNAILLNEIILTLLTFEKEGLLPFLGEFQQLDILNNQEVELQTPILIKNGKALGVTEKGELLFHDNETKQIQKVLSGEISLRLKNKSYF